MRCCVKCQLQYPNQTDCCKVCDIPLIDLPPRPTEPGDAAEVLALVELAGFAHVSEAERIREQLERHEIKTAIGGEANPIGIASGAPAARLPVENKDLLWAREIYRAYFSGDATESAPSGQDQQLRK